MEIVLNDIGKRFNREWIFRNLSVNISSGEKIAITGSNGSGKSTLLQVIAGYATFNEGDISFKKNNAVFVSEEIYTHISIAAPYLELVEEMTALELLSFHHSLKPLSCSPFEALSAVHLKDSGQKQIRYFSSGMKQRLKLAQAFFSQSSVLLLDEPTTNLDKEGIELFEALIQNAVLNRTLIISSNDPKEYACCRQIINIENYKPAVSL